MPHFFITPEQIQGTKITVGGADVRHIKDVLRMKAGDGLTFGDGEKALEYNAVISEIGADSIICELLYAQATDHELPAKIHLFQGLPKGDKMDLVIQKAVELGVHEIIPVAAGRSVVRLSDKKAADKTRRWQAISEAAAKQSRRQNIPVVRHPLGFAEAVALAVAMDIRIIPYEMAGGFDKTKSIIAAIRPGQSVAVFIGPEGGFESREIELALEAGLSAITLGPRILRTETAGLVVLSWMMYELGQ